MVSNARLDLPEPDRPVNTIKESRGRSSEMSLRLCSRAPRMMSWSATGVLPAAGGGLAPVGSCRRTHVRPRGAPVQPDTLCGFGAEGADAGGDLPTVRLR